LRLQANPRSEYQHRRLRDALLYRKENLHQGFVALAAVVKEWLPQNSFSRLSVKGDFSRDSFI